MSRTFWTVIIYVRAFYFYLERLLPPELPVPTFPPELRPPVLAGADIVLLLEPDELLLLYVDVLGIRLGYLL